MASPVRGGGAPAIDPLLERVRRYYDDNHDELERARRARSYFHDCLSRALQARVPPHSRVLEIGPGAGQLLADLKPAHGVGIDISARAVAAARARHVGAHLHFLEGDGSDPRVLAAAGGTFDAIVMVNV